MSEFASRDSSYVSQSDNVAGRCSAVCDNVRCSTLVFAVLLSHCYSRFTTDGTAVNNTRAVPPGNKSCIALPTFLQFNVPVQAHNMFRSSSNVGSRSSTHAPPPRSLKEAFFWAEARLLWPGQKKHRRQWVFLSPELYGFAEAFIQSSVPGQRPSMLRVRGLYGDLVQLPFTQMDLGRIPLQQYYWRLKAPYEAWLGQGVAVYAIEGGGPVKWQLDS